MPEKTQWLPQGETKTEILLTTSVMKLNEQSFQLLLG